MRVLTVFLLLTITTTVVSAQVRINEGVNSNSILEDGEGDTPDWFELYNNGSSQSLNGWTLSDKVDDPTKWPIGDLTIPSGGYLLFWASGKDRRASQSIRTLIQRGDAARFLLPSAPVADDWIELDFDDGSWETGPTGIGFGDEDDATEVPTTTPSVFLRHEFSLEDGEAVQQLILDIDFDDGFIAYVNGREIARANMEGYLPAHNATAINAAEAQFALGAAPTRFTFREVQGVLRDGKNVLAIQVHNVTQESSDLSASAYLSAVFSGQNSEGTAPPERLGLTAPVAHTNFRLSADGETLFLYDDQQRLRDSLTIAGIPSNFSIGIEPESGDRVLYEETTPGGRNPNQGFTGVATGTLTFSRPGGPAEVFNLQLTGAPAGSTVRYTNNGSVPTEESPIYEGNIWVGQTRTIRARIFMDGKLPTPTQTETYIINFDHDLDIVSLVTEPALLFDGVNGIYVKGDGVGGDYPFFEANFWRDVEIPVRLTYFPQDGSEVFVQDIGAKIFGGWSRAQAQRSFSLFARKRYGDGDMDYQFFPDRDYDEFDRLVLRNSGNDWGQTMLRDITMTGLWADADMDIQAYRQVAVYINSDYWGLYNLREKFDEFYLASRYDIDPDSIDILEVEGGIIEGSNEEYLELVDFISSNSLADEANYDYVASEIDIDNFIRYQIAQIYYDNKDWPGHNLKYWRAQRPGAKWRWILFDTDFGGNLFTNNAAASNPFEHALATSSDRSANAPWSTQTLRKLLENEGFRHYFINQFADEMNSRFLTDNVHRLLNENADRIESEIPRSYNRWWRGTDWANKVQQFRDFFRVRPGHMKGFIKDQFDLPAHHEVVILQEDTSEGYVKINSLTIDENQWSGDYFETIPIRLTAVPKTGYTFSHWELDADEADAEIEVEINSAKQFRPVFRGDTTSSSDQSTLDGLSKVRGLTLSPNPFLGAGNLAFHMRGPGHVSLRLYNTAGQLAINLFEGALPAGEQNFEIDLRHLPAGAYTLRIVEDGLRVGATAWVKH